MTRFSFRTAGESHGPALVGIVEGIPSGLELDLAAVDAELVRRQGGYGRGGRMKIESDRLELWSGTRAGGTLGSPLAFRIHNADAVIEKLPVPANPRPGHADLAGCLKHGHRDPRAVLERASARETAARVGAGALARQVLEAFGIEIFAHVLEVGGVGCAEDGFKRVGEERHALRDVSPFMSLDPEADRAMAEAVDLARKEQDSLGGVFEVRALGLPAGLGSYSSGLERLTSRLGAALFSVPAIKSVEVGMGLEAARRRGSEVHDPILPAPKGAALRYARSSNNAGGLEGGLTNGEALVLRAAMKPIPSLRQGLPSVEFESGEAVRATYQRSDVTSVPAASVVGEAVVALALTEAFLDKYGGDSMEQVRAAQRFHQEQMRAL